MRMMARPIIKPILRRATRDITDEEVWSKKEEFLSKEKFGPGNLHDWPWYFEGKSTVDVASPKGIVDWLRGCKYIGDSILFHEKDFWQHPVTFENMRKGDCEDHALWAWRKLKELGLSAELVLGRCGSSSAPGNRCHAWVHVDIGGQRCLMETVATSRQRMTYSLDEVRTKYCPALSVDTDFKTYRYGGFPEFARLQLEAVEKQEKMEKDLTES